MSILRNYFRFFTLFFIVVLVILILGLPLSIVKADAVSDTWSIPKIIRADTFTEVFLLIADWVAGIVATLAVLVIMIGGIQYMASGGNEKKIEGARKTIEDFFPAAVATPPVYQAVPPPSVDAGPTEITQPGMRIVHLPSAPAEAGEPTVITAPMSEAELIAGLFQGFEARVDEMRQQAIQLLASLKRHRANLADEDAPEVTEALRKTIAAQEAKLDGQRAAMQALAEELGAKVATVQAQADALMAPLKALFGTKKEG